MWLIRLTVSWRRILEDSEAFRIFRIFKLRYSHILTLFSLSDKSALSQLETLLAKSSGSSPESESLLIHILDLLQFEDVRPFAARLYVSLLKASPPESKQQVLEVISEANALVEVKIAVEHGSSEDVLKALQNPHLKMENLTTSNAKIYLNRLRKEYEVVGENEYLLKEDLQKIVSEYAEISPEHRLVLEVNGASTRGDSEGVEQILKDFEFFVEENLEFYVHRIRRDKPQNVAELQKTLQKTNEEVEKAFGILEKTVELNKASDEGEILKILKSLKDQEGMREELMHWYSKRLLEDSGDSGASKDSEDAWLSHTFSLGSVYLQTSTRARSRTPMTPTSTYHTWSHYQQVITDENRKFDEYWAEKEKEIVKGQTALRKFLEKKKKAKEAEMRKEQEAAAAKIQSHYKVYRNKKDLELLSELFRILEPSGAL